MPVIHITKEIFQQQVMDNPHKVVLDFWATWCGPCRMVAPILEGIAQEHPEITVGKINVDEEMELAVKYGIVSIPTLVAIQNGQTQATAVGYRPKEELEKLLGI